MEWADLPSRLDELASKLTKPASDIRQAVSGIFTQRQAGYFYQPETQKVAVYGQLDLGDFSRCKSALARAVGRESVRETLLDEARASSGEWIKVAYSPVVRRTGEALNFFPGEYPGGIPNHPSPLAAMLTSALVGGGLGYGLGWAGQKVLPKGYGQNLKRTGALLGALAGVAPGAMWALANKNTGHSLTDSWPFDKSDRVPTDSLTRDRPDRFSTHQDPYSLPTGTIQRGVGIPKETWPEPEDLSRYYPELNVKLGEAYTRAVREFVKSADFGDYGGGFARRPEPTPYDVNINHLGQTLWQSGASTPLLGATLSTMYAAQHMEDEQNKPGWVSGNQLGQLAMNAGKDYLTGLALGALVNTAVGTPFSAPAFGLGNAALGLVRAGVQSLFGG